MDQVYRSRRGSGPSPGDDGGGPSGPTYRLDGPVGLRWRTQKVANLARDQQTVIGLLTRIPAAQGGKREAWPAPPLAGPNGSCPKFVADAIWDFQSFWKSRGVFRNIDGVVDPGGNSIRRMVALVEGKPPDPAPGPTPQNLRLVVSPPRQPGTWQVTNIWSATIGEVGQVGAVQVEITQPDSRKFKMNGVGAGVGVGIDPIAYVKLLGRVADPVAKVTLAAIGEMLAKGIGFNLGDYLQKLGVNLPSVTGGRIIANPINRYVGAPTEVTRPMITGASTARPPFMIASAGGGVLAGMEGGFLSLGGPWGILAPALGIYGTSGVTIKVGVGAQMLLYHLSSVEDA